MAKQTPSVKGLEFTALSNQEEAVVSGRWFEKFDIIPSNLVYNTSQRLNYLTWEVNIKNQRKNGHPYFVSLMHDVRDKILHHLNYLHIKSLNY
jgi:hypothetical protein